MRNLKIIVVIMLISMILFGCTQKEQNPISANDVLSQSRDDSSVLYTKTNSNSKMFVYSNGLPCTRTINIDKAISYIYDAIGPLDESIFFRCEWVEFIGEKAYYMISRNEDYPDRVVTTSWYAIEVFTGDVYKYNIADGSLQPIITQ